MILIYNHYVTYEEIYSKLLIATKFVLWPSDYYFLITTF